ncbi:BgTH12-00874, partial [Blumeria graminis f. sp. triticale]
PPNFTNSFAYSTKLAGLLAQRILHFIQFCLRLQPCQLTISLILIITSGVIPPELPPSVEEAYRAKCIQLKHRLSEVEEANDNARARIVRINRSIQKSRLERAFLLEQLAKRTSANVEDSEGSPSPPPTPKDKPLRIKRGHRKPEFMNNDATEAQTRSICAGQGQTTMSPPSDAVSNTFPDPRRNSTPQTQSQPSKRQLLSNGTNRSSGPSIFLSNQSRQHDPNNAFEVYNNELRPNLENEHRKEILEGSYDLEAALLMGWNALGPKKKNEYKQKLDIIKQALDADEDTVRGGTPRLASPHLQRVEEVEENDVEMADDVSTPVPAPEISGFTAVNRT